MKLKGSLHTRSVHFPVTNPLDAGSEKFLLNRRKMSNGGHGTENFDRGPPCQKKKKKKKIIRRTPICLRRAMATRDEPQKNMII